jgi:ribonuclease Z
MFDYTFLGTAASAPSVQRGLAANLVMHQDLRFLIDCGEGTQRQILRSGLGFRRLDKVLITHGHLDHILGLGGLMSTLTRWDTMEQIEIWAGEGALERIEALLFKVVLRDERMPFKIELREIKTGQFFESETFSLSAFPVTHRGRGCFGFAFCGKPHRPFLAEKATALGIPAGPERRDLVNGIAVTLSDGRVISPDAVLGDPLPGPKLVHIGDTGRIDNLVEACSAADVLVIEATYLEADRDMAASFAHLTARQAAELAKQAGVGTLYLTHLSRRYRDKDVFAEAQAVFPNVVVARDFDQFQVRRRE